MIALLIGPAERLAIAKLKLTAAAIPLEPAQVLAAAETDLSAVRRMMWDNYTIRLSEGIRVTYSHEHQPCGLCHHISISVDRPGKVPAPPVVEMILQEFGMEPIADSLSVWFEDFGETNKAVNLLQLVKTEAAP
jgi:hypothetical protein